MKEKIKTFFSKIENKYLFFALIFGVLMTFVMPPFEVPDEDRHYFKSWEVAEGQIFCHENKNNEIPQSAVALPEKMSLVATEQKKVAKFDFLKVARNFQEKADYTKTDTMRTQFCGAAPFGYLASASILKTSSFLHLPAIVNFYLGRIINLLLSVFLIYLAIKITPVGKITFFFLGLLPMTIQEIASLSYDSLHISLIFLFIAYILKLRQERENKINKKEISLVYFLSLIALNIKFGYFPLAGLIFLLPNDKFKNNKKAWLFKISFSIVNVLFFLLLYKLFSFPTTWPEGVDVQAQMSFVLHHPFYFVKTVFVSTFQNAILYLQGVIGIPGPFRASFPLFTYLLVLIGIPYFLYFGKKEKKLDFNFGQRLWMWTISIINIFLVFFVLYLIWTPVGNDVVLGVQGRYFTVIVLLILLSIQKFEPKPQKVLLYLYPVLLFTSVFYFLSKLYY